VPRDLVVNRLLGRAWLGLKRQGDAIRAWETAAQVAQRTRGPALAEVYAELGPAYLEAGRVDEAITVLDTAVKEAGQTAALSPSLRNLAIALYRRGLGRLRDRAQAEAAFEDLDRAAQTPQSPPKAPLAAKEHAQVMCAAALAALGAGKPERAIEWLGRVAKEGCALRAPYDKAGLEFFVAYAQYRDPGRREAAAKTFSRLAAKAAGPLANVLRDLVRSSYELDGYDAWARGDEKGAALRLRTAARLTTKGERRELDHNLAVIDMTEGRYVAAEKLFEELGPRPPEALVNLGILVDRQGDPKRALDLYKKAADRGARAPKLREWIDVKERLMAGGAK
jgi:tetratricopeptide (TPR) repeat protein